jgi:Cu2+-exporting ATPase
MTVNVVETTAIVLCIAQGYYLAGSVAFSLYYLYKLAAGKDRQEQNDLPDQEHVWAKVAGVDHDILKQVSDLAIGDIIVVEAGEMIPLSGVIADGTALVKRHKSSTMPLFTWMRKCPENAVVTNGQAVEADTIVQLGCVQITITSPQK